MQPGIIVMQDHSFGKFIQSLTFYCTLKFFEGSLTPLGIHNFTSPQKIYQNEFFMVPEHTAHKFSCWCLSFEFKRSRQIAMAPLSRMTFLLRGIVCDPRFIPCYNLTKNPSLLVDIAWDTLKKFPYECFCAFLWVLLAPSERKLYENQVYNAQ